MTQVLNRALPFFMAFVLGIACTAIVRSVLPNHRKVFRDRSRCNWKAKISDVALSIPKDSGSATIDVIEIYGSGKTNHVPFTLSESYSTRLTLKEQALYFRALQEATGSKLGFVVSYVSPEAIDGQPVTSDAVLFNIPRPRFWFDEKHGKQTLDCNAILRVDLGSSGDVSKVERLNGYECPHIGDIIQAASQISFRPAMRNGVPVTQRISLLYRRD